MNCDIDKRLQRWLPADVLASAAYSVEPSIDGAIKLDAMEMPWRWPASMLEQWHTHLHEAAINLYPDPQSRCVIDGLRDYWQVHESLGLIAGNGSDELISLVVSALGGPGRTILAPAPSFAMYPITARNTRSQYVGVPLNSDFSLDKNTMLAAIDEHQPACVFISSPNNPTGNLIERDTINAIIDAAPGVVVIDEAYYAFADDSFLADAVEHSHVLVMRTLSKVGFAGLRVGAMAGHKAWIEQFDKYRLPYNVSVLSQLTVEFALQHTGFIDQCVATIRDERERVARALEQISGLTVYPSATNFLLVKCPPGQGDNTFAALRDRAILVRNFSSAPGLTDCLRLSIGLPEHNQLLVQALSEILAD